MQPPMGSSGGGGVPLSLRNTFCYFYFNTLKLIKVEFSEGGLVRYRSISNCLSLVMLDGRGAWGGLLARTPNNGLIIWLSFGREDVTGLPGNH